MVSNGIRDSLWSHETCCQNGDMFSQRLWFVMRILWDNIGNSNMGGRREIPEVNEDL